jgi:hypothetical protein
MMQRIVFLATFLSVAAHAFASVHAAAGCSQAQITAVLNEVKGESMSGLRIADWSSVKLRNQRHERLRPSLSGASAIVPSILESPGGCRCHAGSRPFFPAVYFLNGKQPSPDCP